MVKGIKETVNTGDRVYKDKDGNPIAPKLTKKKGVKETVNTGDSVVKFDEKKPEPVKLTTPKAEVKSGVKHKRSGKGRASGSSTKK